MGRPVRGDVVVLNFPFTNLSQTKRRPALVLAALEGDDVILCQITSRPRFDGYSIPLEGADFAAGGLKQSSTIRPNKLFTADDGVILYRAGQITVQKLNEVLERLIAILRES